MKEYSSDKTGTTGMTNRQIIKPTESNIRKIVKESANEILKETDDSSEKPKTLIFHWYVHPDGWHKLYDLHLHYLNLYKDVFDEKVFIITHDEEANKEHIERTIDKIKSIMPDAIFKSNKNVKRYREANFVYNGIATRLDKLKDKWYFFAHNKGVDSKYVSTQDLRDWIGLMYFMNLNDMETIKQQMKDDTCVIGTFLIRNSKAWPFLKYKYHFQGTFWWFNPQKSFEIMNKFNNKLPKQHKYISEGLWGSIIPDNDKYRKTALGYGIIKHSENSLPKELKQKYLDSQIDDEKWKEIAEDTDAKWKHKKQFKAYGHATKMRPTTKFVYNKLRTTKNNKHPKIFFR